MKVKELEPDFQPIVIQITLESYEETKRLLDILRKHAKGRDSLNEIVNILNKHT